MNSGPQLAVAGSWGDGGSSKSTIYEGGAFGNFGSERERFGGDGEDGFCEAVYIISRKFSSSSSTILILLL